MSLSAGRRIDALLGSLVKKHSDVLNRETAGYGRVLTLRPTISSRSAYRIDIVSSYSQPKSPSVSWIPFLNIKSSRILS